MKAKSVIALCSNYNGYENVLFRMEANDFRVKNAKRFGYKVLSEVKSVVRKGFNRATGTYSLPKEMVICKSGKSYVVYSDGSAREVV